MNIPKRKKKFVEKRKKVIYIYRLIHIYTLFGSCTYALIQNKKKISLGVGYMVSRVHISIMWRYSSTTARVAAGRLWLCAAIPFSRICTSDRDIFSCPCIRFCTLYYVRLRVGWVWQQRDIRCRAPLSL